MLAFPSLKIIRFTYVEFLMRILICVVFDFNNSVNHF